ncbi:MAG: AI-2E family transporter [Chloroflexota bacterium]
MQELKGVWLRHWHLIVFIVALTVIGGLLYALRSALGPFLIGLVFAYLLLPVVRWCESKLPALAGHSQARRTLIVVVLLVVVFGLIGLTLYLVISTVVSSLPFLLENAPYLISRGLAGLESLAKSFREQFPVEMHEQVSEFLRGVGVAVGNAVRDEFRRGTAFIPTSFSFLIGLVALPVFLFYVLKDSERLSRGFYSGLSPWAAGHARGVVKIVEGVLGRYLRAQLMLGLAVGVMSYIGLLIVGVRFAPALALFAGVTELIPILGPWIGGLFAVIVTLAFTPSKAIWVVVVFVTVQLLENNLLVPRIQGGYLRIHTAVVLVLLVVGSFIAGIWGIILIVPLTATVMEIYRYLRRNAQMGRPDEPSTHT